MISKKFIGILFVTSALFLGSAESSFAVGGCTTVTVAEAQAILSSAAKLGNTPAGRQAIVAFAKIVKQVAVCDVALATELAALAANTPTWAQVAFGTALDGNGTASVGGAAGSAG
jgi:hypothetical protein